jgi:orotate phosphoribosyltransferase
MYNVKQLHDVLRIIFERGTEWNLDGIEHKHNVDKHAPLSPFKFHIAKVQTRPRVHPDEPRLTQKHVNLVGELMLERIKGSWLTVPPIKIASVPKVGEAIAKAIQKAARRKYGVHIPHVRLSKTGTGHKRRITGILDNDGYYPGTPAFGAPLVLIDDLIHHGKSKFEAIDALWSSNYQVTRVEVLIDYRVGAADYLNHRYGIDLDYLATVDSVFSLAEYYGWGNIPPEYIAAARSFLTQERSQVSISR